MYPKYNNVFPHSYFIDKVPSLHLPCLDMAGIPDSFVTQPADSCDVGCGDCS